MSGRTEGGRRRRILIAAGLVVIVAGAGAAAAVSHAGSPRHRDAAAVVPARTAPTTQTAPTTAATSAPRRPFVVAPPVVSATDDGSVIVFTEMRAADGTVHHEWMDEATGSSRDVVEDAQGRRLMEDIYTMTPAAGGQVTQGHILVDYRLARYNTVTVTAPVPPGQPTSTRAADVMKRRITSGELKADGSEVVGGRRLSRYVPTEQPIRCDADPDPAKRAACEAAPHGVGVWWVEPGTLRPVKELHAGGTVYEYTRTYAYLPRTRANLANLGTTVPASVTKSDLPGGMVSEPPPTSPDDRIDRA